MRCIVCGGRDFDKNNYPELENQLIDLFKTNNVDDEVCGLAKGADMYGSEIAHQLGIKVSDFPAHWSNLTPSEGEPVQVGTNQWGKPYNSLAGINRNRRMADYAAASSDGGLCIALPGGPGTQNMIKQARKHGLKVYVWNNDSKTFIEK